MLFRSLKKYGYSLDPRLEGLLSDPTFVTLATSGIIFLAIHYSHSRARRIAVAAVNKIENSILQQ